MPTPSRPAMPCPLMHAPMPRARTPAGRALRGVREAGDRTGQMNCPDDWRGNWRRRWDSNPRDGSPPTPLAGERLRPLGHVSAERCSRSARGDTGHFHPVPAPAETLRGGSPSVAQGELPESAGGRGKVAPRRNAKPGSPFSTALDCGRVHRRRSWRRTTSPNPAPEATRAPAEARRSEDGGAASAGAAPALFQECSLGGPVRVRSCRSARRADAPAPQRPATRPIDSSVSSTWWAQWSTSTFCVSTRSSGSSGAS
jgi:hypothetical protein